MIRMAPWTAGLGVALMLAGCIGLGEKVAGGNGNGSETTNGITARILAPDGVPPRGLRSGLTGMTMSNTAGETGNLWARLQVGCQP